MHPVSRATVTTFADAEALARAAAARIVEICRETLAEHPHAHLALAGGSTPRRTYEVLATEPLARQVDWPRVHLWFGDERHVPADHPDSNYRMAARALLDRLPPPGPVAHRMPAEREDLRLAAAGYAEELTRTVPPGPGGAPALDLVLLGLGADGHTASLFPGTCVLHDDRAVAAVYVPRLLAWRMSLGLGVINAARHVLFLVAGADKAEAVGRVLRPAPGERKPPAARVAPAGTFEWYLDVAAASALGGRR
jgi:6-phosphogluconolactonase